MSPRRHDLLWLADWSDVLARHPELEPWAARGWPLVARRRLASDPADEWPAGVTLPDRKRLALTVRPAHVGRVEPPPLLADMADRLPRDWRPAIARVPGAPRLFGSAMWSCLTGLPLLRTASDLDLLWDAPSDLNALLAAIEAADGAPPRLDGDIRFGAAGDVQWAEARAAGPDGEVLVKDERSVRLMTLSELRADWIAGLAHACLMIELETMPKPGLVSPRDQGSHPDMDASLLAGSADSIRPFFARLAQAGRQGAAFPRLQAIGIEAEAAMMQATGGVNTHRGAIFGLGLLCAASGAAAAGFGSLVAERWGPAIMKTASRPGGARAEAAGGFPSISRIGLPALTDWRSQAARVQCLFALVAGVEDTNLLRRGGIEGAAYARAAARRFLDEGGVHAPGWESRAWRVHDEFVARRLSPGGCADLLAMTLFVARLGAASSP